MIEGMAMRVFGMMAGALAMLAAAPAMATDWTMVAMSDTQIGVSVIFADRDSLKTADGDIRQVRMTYVLANDRRGIAAYVSDYEFDCAGGLYRSALIIAYDVDGKKLGESNRPNDWQQAIPGQSTGAMADFICSGKISSKDTPGLGADLPIAYARKRISEAGK